MHVKQTFFYENDLLVKRANFHRELDIEHTETSYKYDSNNNAIEIMTTSEDGKELEYQQFVYNEQEDVIEWKGDSMPTIYAGFEFQQAFHHENIVEYS
ncbi:MAG: hypothetical protein ACJAWV_003613 [Flammeovirgaceae bacterium]